MKIAPPVFETQGFAGAAYVVDGVAILPGQVRREKIKNASVEELKNVLNEKDAITLTNYFMNPKD